MFGLLTLARIPGKDPPQIAFTRFTMDSSASDQQLLRQFLHTRDERLLRPLMERHLPLVYATALRAAGDPGLAAEAAQDVFIKLVRTPGALMKDSIPLIAWLHRTARHRAIDLTRTEKARRERERIAADLSPTPSAEALPPEALAMLDEIIDKLPPLERDLVLQRYFLGRQLSIIGQQKGLSEDAVRMRLKRALEKMRGLFQLRGVMTTTALLASALPGYGATAPPAAVAASVLKAMARSAGAAPQISLSTLIHFMTTTQKYATGASLLLLAGILTVAIPRFTTGNRKASVSPFGASEDTAPSNRAASGNVAPKRSDRTASDYPELVQRYGESRTRLALHLAKNVAQFTSDTSTIDRSPSFSAEQYTSRQSLLNDLAEKLNLRDDQKEFLLQILPEWEQRSTAQTTMLAEQAQANPAAIAETALAMDNWSDGRISEDEVRQVLSRTSATIGESSRDLFDLLGFYEFIPATADPFGEFPELSRKLESVLDPVQAAKYHEFQLQGADPDQLAKGSLEKVSVAIEYRMKQTTLWAEKIRTEGE